MLPWQRFACFCLELDFNSLSGCVEVLLFFPDILSPYFLLNNFLEFFSCYCRPPLFPAFIEPCPAAFPDVALTVEGDIRFFFFILHSKALALSPALVAIILHMLRDPIFCSPLSVSPPVVVVGLRIRNERISLSLLGFCFFFAPI